MRQRTLTACLMAIIAIITICALGSAEARAQVSNCCHFTVDASLVNPNCIPIPVTTAWAGFPVLTRVYTAPGVYVQPFTPPFYPPCPPVPQFLWVSLNSGTTQIPFNVPTRTTLNGCCVIVHVVLDGDGCILINISSC